MESPSNQNSSPESYVTLKVNVPECGISKTIRFNANQTVQEAIAVIKLKVGNQFLEQIVADNQNGVKSPNSNSTKKSKSDSKEKKKSNEFGMFICSRTIWMDDLDTLAFYEIREMETVDFKLKPETEDRERRNSLTGSLRKKIASSFRRKSDADSTQSSAKEVVSVNSTPSPARSRRNSSNYITPAMLASIPCQEGHYRVIVECPHSITQHMAEFDKYVTVLQLKQAVAFREKIEDAFNFALYIRVTSEPRETMARLTVETSTLFDYKVHELGRNLVLKRLWLPLNIRLEDGKVIKWLVSPSWTVHFILRMMKVYGKRQKGYGLFLVTAKSLHRRQNSSELSSSESQPTSPLMNYEGMLMEKKRKLASYRLGISDVLEYKSESLDLKKKLESSKSEENIAENLFIVIESPEQGISKTFHFSSNATIAEVIETFILKNPLIPYTENDSSSSEGYKVMFEDDKNYKRYGLYQKQMEGSVTPPSPSRKEQHNQNSLSKLDYSQTLRFYKLPHMARLIFKSEEKDTVQNANDGKPDYFKFPSSIVDSQAGFGVPVQNLPFVTDVNGLKVPAVLVILKKCIIDKRGFEQEGIFRINGMETQLTEFRTVIGATLAESTDSSRWDSIVLQLKDVNCAATLIKRWYLNLPTKVLAGVPIATMQNWRQHQSSVTEIVSQLDEPAKSLFHWLMDIALEVVKNQDQNKMSAKSIARLFSALLIDLSSEAPQQALQVSSLLSTVLEVSINVELLIQDIEGPPIDKDTN